MATKTAPVTARITTSTEPSYTELLRRVRALFSRDVESRFEIALIFSKMLKLKTAEEISQDTDVPPGGIKKMAQVAEFWGNVRIKADGAGKRPAPWNLYDRIALDPMLSDDLKQQLKRIGPTKGLTYVREQLRQARDAEVKKLDALVHGDQSARSTAPKPPRSPRRSTDRGASTGAQVALGAVTGTDALEEADGEELVDRAVTAINDAIRSLNQLESLSETDAQLVRVKIDALVKHLLRLRG